mgnify:CR=1 FL=1
MTTKVTRNMLNTSIDDNGNATAITIDSSERITIGSDSGDAFNDDSMLRLQKTGDRVFMQFKTDADQNSGILFGDVDDDVECAIEYEPANKALTLSTGNNTEAMRIGSDQTTTFANEIIIQESASPTLKLDTTSAATSAATLNLEGYRTTADVGALVKINAINARDGDTHASFEIYAAGDTNGFFRFNNTASTQIARLDTDGLKFGTDTATASALDDYEEGVWTPTSVANIDSLTNVQGFYTKIGRMVYCLFHASVNPTSTSSGFTLGGLPFTVKQMVTHSGIQGTNAIFSDSALFLCFPLQGGTTLSVELDRPMQGSASSSSASYRGSFMYATDQ